MPSYTKNLYDSNSVVAVLSGVVNDAEGNSKSGSSFLAAAGTSMIDLSGFTQWDTNKGGLNPIDGFEVGSVLTFEGGTTEYTITAIIYNNSGLTQTNNLGSGYGLYEARVTLDKEIVAGDRGADNSGNDITRKYYGPQGSLATHLRKRHLGYI